MNFNEQLEKKNRRIKIYRYTRYGISLLLIGLTLGYFLSPLASLKNSKVNGTYLNTDEVFKLCSLNENDSLYSLDQDEIKTQLESYDFISAAQVDLSIKGLDIVISEKVPVGYYQGNLYDTNGLLITYDLVNNESNAHYLELCKSNLVTFLNEVPSKTKTDYLKLTQEINLDNKFIYYLEDLNNDFNFGLYYNIKEGTFLKILLNMTSAFDLDTYVTKFKLSQEEREYLFTSVNKKQTLLHNDTYNFDYLEVNASLINDGSIKKYYTF